MRVRFYGSVAPTTTVWIADDSEHARDLDQPGISTSPNAEGRRARFSLTAGGETVEVVENLDPGVFTSRSIDFDLDQRVALSAPNLIGHLRCTPLYAQADYSDAAIPSLPGGTKLTHFQRAGRFFGEFTINGRPVSFEGVGIRDRTWGSRDESASIAEYIGVMAVFENSAVTVIRMRTTDGIDHTEGFLLDDHTAVPITGIDKIRRDGSGLFVACELTVSDQQGRSRVAVLEGHDRAGGFWVPMGWERVGPTMSAYDEYLHARTSEGATGAVMIEQGTLRTL
jgi:hypothetical protein